MTLQDVVARFNTVPFLFAGSGVTRRYYDLPDWKGLLSEFASRVNPDRFAYNAYINKATQSGYTQGVMPKAATLIQHDFDETWYSNPVMRTNDSFVLNAVESGCSPFKAEIAFYLKEKSIVLPEYKDEIQKLKNISKKNLAGVITTNYDTFFEKLFDDYTSYVGQDQLVFSSIQGVAEIYKIHGSVSIPDSLVINEQDYEIFCEKGKYLAAKLMTIFMEYPIIFIGYSLTDHNVQNILRDILTCLPKNKIDRLQERFVFVEYDKTMSGYTVSSHTLAIGDTLLSMTKLVLSDFGILYDALAAKKASVPVKILRRFKEEIYTYAITNKPGPLLKVGNLDDKNINENQLAISIGISSTGELGLQSIIHSNEWYRGIVLDDLKELNYTADQLLKYAYPEIRKENTGDIPVYRFLAQAQEDYPQIRADTRQNFDDLASKTNKKFRYTTHGYSGLQDLWETLKDTPAKAYRTMCSLPEEKMDADYLEQILLALFKEDPDVLEHLNGNMRADIKRLIRMYDYLKWGKKIKTQTKQIPIEEKP